MEKSFWSFYAAPVLDFLLVVLYLCHPEGAVALRTIKRQEGWEARLMHKLETVRELKFEWGKMDCVIWVADCIEAMTCVDMITNIRGTYHDKVSAYAVIHQLGGSPDSTLADCVSQYFEEINVRMAKRGDILMFNKALGVCFGVYGVFLTDTHYSVHQTVFTDFCDKAWMVPF